METQDTKRRRMKLPPQINIRMKKTPGKGCSTAMECLWEERMVSLRTMVGGSQNQHQEWWGGSQHGLNMVKTTFTSSFNSHNNATPSSCVMNILLSFENCIKQQDWPSSGQRNSFSFHESLFEANESGQGVISWFIWATP